MPRINSPAELEALRKSILSEKDPDKPCIAICAGTNCLALGNQAVIQAFKAELAQQELTDKVDIRATGCHGLCERGPNVLIYPEEIYYIEVKPEDVAEIISETVLGKKVVDRLLYTDPLTGEKAVHQTDIPFYKKQTRMIINTNTLIDPQKIEDYLSIGGYTALSKALFEMTPESILNEIKTANLRGRGGGGFPAGLKWETARNAPGEQKYVIVNGHEGEPGAFMDRAIFTGNPHNVIEGLIIGAFAVGASQGFIYTRHDMPQLKENIYTALAQAEEYGLLGDNILGSGFNFHVEVHFDVGIFVSGESSALMRSIEGKNPEPRPKYIRTSVSGIWDKPSNLNNVETWANVPLIINKGHAWYTGIGTEKSKGTKLVSVSGHVKNTAVVEVPMGTTLREIVFDICGGIPGDKKLKAVHFGGAMGGSIPENLLDTPLDFDALSSLGATMGAGGMLVLDEDTSMVQMTRTLLDFLSKESCGKCVPCREGVRQMLKVMDRLCENKGRPGDIELLEDLCEVSRKASLCSLGRTAYSPVLSTLRFFREEYEASIAP
ncbi:NADH:ubiquinone oxidoreductase, NADH-binding (51 kD) subunit [Desulfosarcina cetonica]|nr:NADH:ubiquinone oxidoreductase, NADH-binding (51 kD) subunit [Desulfosarcina cetonica]